MIGADLAVKWIKYAFDNEKDSSPVEKFVFVWFAFNTYYGEELFSYEKETGNRGSELEAIKKSLRIYQNSKIIEELKNKLCFQYFIDHDVYNTRGNNNLTKPDRNRKHSGDITSNNPQKWLNGYSTIVYGVRCNLFHGTKQAYEKRDFTIIANTLECLCWMLLHFCHDSSIKSEIERYKTSWENIANAPASRTIKN